jgi:hypothetical protein
LTLDRKMLEKDMDHSPQMRATRLAAKTGTTEARIRRSLTVLAWGALAATRLAFADPAPDAGPCAATSPQEAKALADRLYDNGEYQRAGECYDVAGDSMRAQRAFLRAAGPSAEVAARGLKDEGHTAKALLTQVQQAFRSNH